MNSLLSEELKKYNTNNLDKNIEKQNFEKILIKNIENKNLNNKEVSDFINKEYSVNMNIFNPMKNSPPNYWNDRLLSRINSLNNFN